MEKKSFSFLILCTSGLLAVPFIVSSQNKYVVNIVQPDPVLAPVINMVTVSSENKNLVVWEQTPNDNIQYFNIYRDGSNPNDPWINVGKAMYPGSNYFSDGSSFPTVRSYQYLISTIDLCGNEIYNNRLHKTINLNAVTLNDTICFLNWNAYEGFDIEGYNIYWGPDENSLSLMDSTSELTTSYVGKERLNKEVFYQVEAVVKTETITSETKLGIKGNKTLSNIASNSSFFSSSDSTDAPTIQIYPNPFTVNALVLFSYDPSQKCQLTILDLAGHIVYSQSVFAGEIEIERKDLKEGMYILQIAGKKVFRKKLMVGRTKA